MNTNNTKINNQTNSNNNSNLYDEFDIPSVFNKMFEASNSAGAYYGKESPIAWYFVTEDTPWSTRDYTVYMLPDYFRYEMNWNQNDIDNIIASHKSLYSAIEKIAAVTDSDTLELKEEIPEDLKNVWNTYIRPFKFDLTNTYDTSIIEDIDNKMAAVLNAEALSERISNGNYTQLAMNLYGEMQEILSISDEAEKLYQTNLYIYNEIKDISVSDEERKLFNSYYNDICSVAENRIGKKICAINVIIAARILLRVMAMKAPEIIIKSKSAELAIFMAINTYCTAKEQVDYSEAAEHLCF